MMLAFSFDMTRTSSQAKMFRFELKLSLPLEITLSFEPTTSGSFEWTSFHFKSQGYFLGLSRASSGPGVSYRAGPQ